MKLGLTYISIKIDNFLLTEAYNLIILGIAFFIFKERKNSFATCIQMNFFFKIYSILLKGYDIPPSYLAYSTHEFD